MKKLLVILMVVAMASFLFVGCLPGTTTPVVVEEEEEEVEEVVVPATVAPIIIGVTDGAYINKVEAADGIIVNGTAPTYSEVKIYINDICAGTGDTLADGTWIVVVAKADLGADGDKVLYATAKEAALDVSAKSNEKEFTLDTVAPKISAVKARAGTLRLYRFVETTDSIAGVPDSNFFSVTGFPFTEALINTQLALINTVGAEYFSIPALALPGTLWTGEQLLSPFAFIPATNPLMAGVKNWRIEIITVLPPLAKVRVDNLTDGTVMDYTFTNGGIVSTSWIPGLAITLPMLFANTDIGGYCLITTTNTPEVRGRVSLTFDEDVSWTQAIGGAYTIYNGSLGWDILTNATAFMAYNEAADTMFWQELVNSGSVDLRQGDWLTFQVDGVADVAGNAIPVTAPETANTVVLASTIVIGP